MSAKVSNSRMDATNKIACVRVLAYGDGRGPKLLSPGIENKCSALESTAVRVIVRLRRQTKLLLVKAVYMVFRISE